MKALTTHILDTSRGLPAPGVPVRLERAVDEAWQSFSDAVTDSDGRARLSFAGDHLEAGRYRLTFEVASYFDSLEIASFYPIIQIVFLVTEERHYHVPLLLSSFGFSTYRGS